MKQNFPILFVTDIVAVESTNHVLSQESGSYNSIQAINSLHSRRRHLRPLAFIQGHELEVSCFTWGHLLNLSA